MLYATSDADMYATELARAEEWANASVGESATPRRRESVQLDAAKAIQARARAKRETEERLARAFERMGRRER